MKTICIILLAMLFQASAYCAETNRYDFSAGKKIHESAGAWIHTRGDNMAFTFFFDDGTGLYVFNGNASVGRWKFTNKDETKLMLTYHPDSNKHDIFKATITEDILNVDHGDYPVYWVRAHGMISKKPNQQVEPIVTTPVDKVKPQSTQTHP